jgi:hypothetical protein
VISELLILDRYRSQLPIFLLIAYGMLLKNYSWNMTPDIIITTLLYTKIVYTRLTKGSIPIGLIYQPGLELAANILYHLKAVMMI